MKDTLTVTFLIVLILLFGMLLDYMDTLINIIRISHIIPSKIFINQQRMKNSFSLMILILFWITLRNKVVILMVNILLEIY